MQGTHQYVIPGAKIQIVIGNMLEEAPGGFMVHGCNCQGVMGSGIAAAIRKKWPNVFRAYLDKYTEGYYDRYLGVQTLNQLRLGTIIPVEVDQDGVPLMVVNAMTQKVYQGHPDNPKAERYVNYESLARAMRKLNALPKKYPHVAPILHFPLIGAGLAKGNWQIIGQIIDQEITEMEKILWILPE